MTGVGEVLHFFVGGRGEGGGVGCIDKGRSRKFVGWAGSYGGDVEDKMWTK